VEYSRGFEDALKLALLRIKGLKRGWRVQESDKIFAKPNQRKRNTNT